jgi:hypothetical protein
MYLICHGESVGAGLNIADGGKVGIGTTSPGWIFTVDNSASNDAIAVINNASPTEPDVLKLQMSGSTQADTNEWFLYCENQAEVKAIIYSNGAMQNKTGSFVIFSDEKLKTGIKDAKSQWDDIKGLRIRNFKWISDGSDAESYIGVIAQEAEKICPGLVFESELRDGTKQKGFKQSILYMKAVKALQEAMARIESLETKVTALENA